jgi:AcrR family transcriptional regulator
LIDTSAALFRVSGYDGTALQDIADAVGIQKGSLYHYIDTKEDLLFAVVREVHERTANSNIAWKAIEGDPVGALRAFIEGHIRASIENLTFAEVYFRDFRALTSDRKAEIIDSRDQYEHQLRSLISDALTAGLIRGDVNPSLATRVVFGIINWIYYWYRPDGALGPEEIVAALSQYCIAALGPAHSPVG